jgi:hypothetical protein
MHTLRHQEKGLKGCWHMHLHHSLEAYISTCWDPLISLLAQYRGHHGSTEPRIEPKLWLQQLDGRSPLNLAMLI